MRSGWRSSKSTPSPDSLDNGRGRARRTKACPTPAVLAVGVTNQRGRPTLSIVSYTPQAQWVNRRDAADDDGGGGNGGETGTWRQRYDTPGNVLLRPVERDDGSLLAEGFVAKPGILVYKDREGNTTRELIPAEELHRSDSLGTLARVALTLEHPDVDVSKDNVGTLGVGDVDSIIDASEAGGFVRIRLAIRRADAIKAVKAGKVQLSPGYRVRVDPTPGIDPRFGPFDAVQRNRQYNHVALVDMARGGPDIRLRADGAAYQIPDEQREVSTVIINPNLLALLALLGANPTEFKTDDAGIAEVKRRFDALNKRNDGGHTKADREKMEVDMQTLRDEVKSLTGKLATITGVADAFKAKADADEADEKTKADAAERKDLIGLAKSLKIDSVEITDEKTALADLRTAIVTAHLDGLGAKLPDEPADDYIRGILSTIPRADKADAVNQWESVSVDPTKVDAAPRKDAAPATATQIYRQRADAAFKIAKAGNAASAGGSA